MWSNFLMLDRCSPPPAIRRRIRMRRGRVLRHLSRRPQPEPGARTRTFAVGGVLQDVSLQVGFDSNTKNTEFAPAKKLLVFGPDFHWTIPGGFLCTAIQFSKEWNNNGIIGKSVEFDPAIEFETVWSVPLGLHRPAAELRRLRQPGRAQGKGRFRQRDQDRGADRAAASTSMSGRSPSTDRASSTPSSATSTGSTNSAMTTPRCRARSPTPSSSACATIFERRARAEGAMPGGVRPAPITCPLMRQAVTLRLLSRQPPRPKAGVWMGCSMPLRCGRKGSRLGLASR